MVDTDLSSLVWHERRALDEVLFSLQTVRLHLEQSGERWLERTVDALLAAVEALRVATLERTVMSATEVDRSLQDLAADAAAPLDAILTDHRVTMRERVREIEAERDRIVTLLAVRETAGSAPPSAGAEADGVPPDGLAGPDEADVDADIAAALAGRARLRARMALTDLVPSELSDLLR
ncbi:hypothetical protein GCM10011512_29090 [Tersicoccus solisilvae]|uniref:Uncharacterized protein n=1 Tax=Tersicoccus solisilvae TaxID=1882339 RepID=A0ABQ1PNP3_9MICC|nr:hypothetical protein [Tersicoccus solisilvae]GGD00394.1 hypothetical protein GCM10011512_29090 [Tersicoccus solisilvae]